MLLHLPTPHHHPIRSIHTPPHLRFRPKTLTQTTETLSRLGISLPPSSTPETLTQIQLTVNYLTQKGFPPSSFPRLSLLCPTLFSSSPIPLPDLDVLFSFLATALPASPEQSRHLLLKCPQILAASVDLRLRPTVAYLHRLGLRTLGAHLINTPVERLVETVEFLEGAGLSGEEAAEVCRRCPAVFGYSVDFNLRPKVDFLVGEMGRDVREILKFPQYFAFSLEKKIVPRHLHLKKRKGKVSLHKMLRYSDARFYEKWK